MSILKDGNLAANGVVSGGIAYPQVFFDEIGDHTLSAVYYGDSNNAPSTAASITQTIGKNQSSVQFINARPNPVATGQNTHLTASLSAVFVGASGSTPSASVTFMDGATTLGTAPIDGTTFRASLDVSFAAAGTHNLTLNFAGDSLNLPSTSSVLALQVNTGGIVLSAPSTPTLLKHPVVLTAVVSGSGQPSGTVTFMDGTSTLATVNLSGGSATYSATFTTAGDHTLTANYSGDANNPASSSNVVVKTILYAPSTTTLSTNVNPVTVGQTVTLSAFVLEGASVPAGLTLSGQVAFMDGSTVLGQAPISPVGSAAGTAQLAVNFATPGIHLLTAKYSGDHATSVSNAIYEQVGSTTTAPPGPMTWQYGFDAQGGLVSQIDPNGNQTVNRLDPLRRKVAVVQAVPGTLGPVVNLAYDGQDRIAAVTDPRSLVTTYSVDGLGNAASQVSPDSGTTNATFDAAGNLLTQTDARGKTKTFVYDDLNRVTSISYPTGTPTLYEYDGGASPTPTSIGHLTKITDESGSTTFTYDGFGRVLTKVQQVGTQTLTIGYTWGTAGSANGKLAAIRYPSGHQVNYGYDVAGRVNAITVNPVNSNGVGTNTGSYLNILSGVTYNGDNSLLGWTWANNAPYTRGFDSFGRLNSYPMGYPAGTGTASGLTRTLTLDNGGRITGFTHANSSGPQPAANQLMAYDNLNRLTSQTLSTSSYAYGFDANGNRTSRTVGATTFANTVDTLSNRLTQIQTGTTTPVTQAQTYDNAGSLTGDGSATYAYGDRGRMTSTAVSGGAVTYLYNGQEQRVKKSGTLVPTGAAYFAYDEAGQLIGEYDANLSPVSETVYIGSTPVAVLKETGSAAAATLQASVGNVYADHLDTPRVITRNSDEAIQWRWDSAEAFGATPPNENPNALGSYKLNLRFPGQVFDSEVGNFYNWHRDYIPALGRYVQVDPAGLNGGTNGYAYVTGNPLIYADPAGLWTIQLGFSITGAWMPTVFGLGPYGQIGVGFAFDGNGNFGGYWTTSGGGALGTPDIVAGVQGAWSNGDTICDLAGTATNVGLNAAGGWGGTVDAFGGRGTRNQSVGGLGITIGGGAGVSGYVGKSYTDVNRFGNSSKCACSASK